MAKLFSIVLGLLAFSQITMAAPYYTGIGCNADGTKCAFGKPSKRVLKWSKKGTIAELGSKCDKFLENIESRKNVIAQQRPVVLDYRNFHYSWSSELEPNGQAKIICEVEIHSELENVKIIGETYQKLTWVCDNEQTPGICKHYKRDCEASRDQALRDNSVLDATIYSGSSLATGEICYVTVAKFK